MKNALLIIVLVIICSCSKSDDEISKNQEISIYQVKDGQISKFQKEVDIDTLVLEETAWLEHSEIDFYDWSSYYLYSKVPKKASHLKYYVVKVGDERVLLGSYLQSGSSQMYKFMGLVPMFSGYVIRFYGFNWFYDETSLGNKNLKEALINEDLINYGIDFDMIELKRKDNTTLLYTYEITNQDVENIYVFDTDVMGPKHFSYYTNGVGLSQNEKYYNANFEWESPEDGIPESWFYKLNPGESILRTVELKGFSNLPTGTVNCHFVFPGGYLPKDTDWKTNDGRYWLGEIRIEKEMVII